MKRAFFGFLWFIVFAFGSLTIGGAVAGGMASANLDVKSKNFSDAYSAGHQAGQGAGAEFAAHYAGKILLAALFLSIAGTVFGVLPGTKKRPKN
jgi:hypothetical protein